MKAVFRVIISFGLGPPEVAQYMTETFGEVFGQLGANRLWATPRP